MVVKDWAQGKRWYIGSDSGYWYTSPSDACFDDYSNLEEEVFSTFAEALAAYLDVVTCEKNTPFPAYSESRCYRAKGHEGGHLFKGKNGLTDLQQMPR